MSKEQPLSLKLYFDPSFTDLVRIVGYVGFPFRELAEKVKPLIQQYGIKRVSLAITETLSFAGWRVMLNEQTRPRVPFIGPPPETWDAYYRHIDGSPRPRPPGRETPPVIPDQVPDPFLQEIVHLTVADLIECLQAARRKKNGMEDVAGLESELIRRGSEIPPEVPPKPEVIGKRRTRKK